MCILFLSCLSEVYFIFVLSIKTVVYSCAVYMDHEILLFDGNILLSCIFELSRNFVCRNGVLSCLSRLHFL